jgi:hypothetical protein
MSPALRRSLAVLALAMVFWAFFQGAKQIALLAEVNPFGEDPYDAIGSFGIQAAAALAILSVLRGLGFLNHGEGARLVARTQLASVLAVGITLAADAIALLRHPAATLLVPLVVVLGCLAVVVGVWCCRGVDRRPGGMRAAIVVCAVAGLVLFFYPEGTRSDLIGALIAIAAGIVLLFVPMRVLTTSLIGGDIGTRSPGFPLEWLLVVGAALVLGALVAYAEAESEGGLRPGVAFIFVGFELAAGVFGYAMMRGPLALRLR